MCACANSQAESDAELLLIANGERLANLVRSHSEVTFSTLSNFLYEGSSRVLPPEVAALNGKQVAIKGMVMPTVADQEGIGEFLLTPYVESCCWGGFTSANQFVVVTLKRKTQELQGFEELTVFGQLSVGDEVKDGQLLSVYRLRGDALGTRKGLEEIATNRAGPSK
jgi:hypothetical protein